MKNILSHKELCSSNYFVSGSGYVPTVLPYSISSLLMLESLIRFSKTDIFVEVGIGYGSTSVFVNCETEVSWTICLDDISNFKKENFYTELKEMKNLIFIPMDIGMGIKNILKVFRKTLVNHKTLFLFNLSCCKNPFIACEIFKTMEYLNSDIIAIENVGSESFNKTSGLDEILSDSFIPLDKSGEPLFKTVSDFPFNISFYMKKG